jgi:drug/metabolite transporter (DMT)-like permease
MGLDGRRRGVVGAATAMFCVGTLTGVSPLLHHYPVYGGQALRYLAGSVLLVVVARMRGHRLLRPDRREVAFLLLLAAVGLAAFNVFVVEATRSADPAPVGTIVATVPVVLAVVGPLTERRRPAPRAVLAAVVVAAGAAVSSGLGGGGGAVGVLLALAALGCEAGFSLLAVPVLPRLGAVLVSAYSCAAAVPLLLVAGLVTDGTGAVPLPDPSEALALAYLAVVVTVFAFVCWYVSLPRLGPATAGLFSGFLPVGAIASALVLGTGRLRAADAVGVALVAVGLLLGMRPVRSRAPAQPGAAGQPVGG